ncbi:MAG: hypothetical protein GX359_03150 [Clostridiales bacterium]|nr:hypothetical protein [Clostridiales bacterium]
MRRFLQKITNSTTSKHKVLQNRLLLFKLGCTVIMAILLACISVTTALAASGLKIYDYDSKKNITYTGKQVKVKLNGKQISKDNTPGIIIDGIALLSYKDIFANSPIKAECVYNKPERTVTISKNGTTIVLTLNSKTAVVNGKKVTMPVAPVKIKYRFADVTKILVPSRFVAENLGYKYTWYSARSTVEIEGETEDKNKAENKKDKSKTEKNKADDSFIISVNGGEKFTYTGSFANLTIDGTKIGLGNMPSIIVDNTTMVRAKRVFADSKIKANYSFNSKDNTVTLSKDGNELKMKIGDTTAYLNGDPVEMTVPAAIVTNHKVNTNFVMVPGRFTANSLGYDYTWNQNKVTSEISTPVNDSSDDSEDSEDEIPDDENSGLEEENTDPELGDESVIFEKGTILRQWLSNEALFGKSTNVHNLTYNGQITDDTGFITVDLNDRNQQFLNVETYQFPSTKPYGNVIASSKGNRITIQVPGMMSMDQSFNLSGARNSIIDNIATKYDSTKQTTTIEIKLHQENVSYDLSLTPDRLNLNVNLYKNSINSATLGTNSVGDYITLTGAQPLDVQIQNQNGLLMLDLPYTVNGIGDQYYSVSGSKFIKQFFVVSLEDRTQVFLELQGDAEYYIIENGNWYTLSLQPKGSLVKPELPNKEEKPGNINKNDFEILIPKPEGLRSYQVSDQDDYLKKQFVIILDGNYVSYFDNHPIEVNSSRISDFSVKFKDNKTEIRFTTKKIQGYKYEIDDSYIYIKVDNPRNIYKNIVVLDPGHGGGAKGASYFGTNEKDLNFKMLYTLGKKYFDSDTSEIKAYYTRTTDKDVDLYDRAAFVKEVGADLFVSLHMNASTSKSVNGTEVYYSSSNNSKNSSGLNSERLASMFLKDLVKLMGTKNRGTKSARFVVVHRNTVPAVLIELGFMSNKADFNKISNASYQEKVAKSIYETLCDVFEKYPTGR